MTQTDQTQTKALLCFAALVACLIAVPSFAIAQSYDLSWNTIDGGGGMSSVGGAYALSGTIGQTDAQTPTVMTGSGFTLAGGFWPGMSVVCSLPGDLNLDGSINGRDVQMFTNCILNVNGSNCACADFDASGDATSADLSLFVSTLLGS